MGHRALFLGILLLLIGVVESSATVRIADDRGGKIGAYMQTFAMLRSSGESVVIDGPCLSACTLILSVLSNEQVCVTRRARLGFHAAWRPGPGGQPQRSMAGTKVLMDSYPPKVRRWIRRKGGLSSRMIYLQGRELVAFFPRCHARR